MNLSSEIHEIQKLISSQEIVAAEEKCMLVIENNPHCKQLWDLLISIQLMTPLEDYESATKYLEKAYTLFPSNHIYYALKMYFKETFLSGLNDYDRKEISNFFSIIDSKSRAILSIVLAKSYWNVDNRLYQHYLLSAIKNYPEFINPYFDLATFYLERGKNNKGKECIEKGLSKIYRVYSNSNSIPFDTSIDFFVDDEIGGIYIEKKKYLKWKNILK